MITKLPASDAFSEYCENYPETSLTPLVAELTTWAQPAWWTGGRLVGGGGRGRLVPASRAGAGLSSGLGSVPV